MADLTDRIYDVDFNHPDPGSAAVGVYYQTGENRYSPRRVDVDTVTANEIIEKLWSACDYADDGWFRFDADAQERLPRFSELAAQYTWPAGAKVEA